MTHYRAAHAVAPNNSRMRPATSRAALEILSQWKMAMETMGIFFDKLTYFQSYAELPEGASLEGKVQTYFLFFY